MGDVYLHDRRRLERIRMRRNRNSPLQQTSGNVGLRRPVGIVKSEYHSCRKSILPINYLKDPFLMATDLDSHELIPGSSDPLIVPPATFHAALQLFKSESYDKYILREHREKCKTTGLPLWCPKAESLFKQLNLLIPPVFGKVKIMCLHMDGSTKKYGRNDLFARILEQHNAPVVYDRKKLSSHIQVIKKQLVSDGQKEALRYMSTDPAVVAAIKAKDLYFDESAMTFRFGAVINNLDTINGMAKLKSELLPVLDHTLDRRVVQAVDFKIGIYQKSVPRIARHTCTSLQTPGGAPAKSLAHVMVFEDLFPRLQEILEYENHCEVIWFESAIEKPQQTPSIPADCATYVGIDFNVTIMPGEDLIEWKCETSFYQHSGELIEEYHRDLQVELLNDSRINLKDIALLSPWWVQLFVNLIRQKQNAGLEAKLQLESIAHEPSCECQDCIFLRDNIRNAVEAEEDRATRYFRGLSIMQCVYATPRLGGPRRCVAMFLFKFDQARGCTALTTWHRVIRHAEDAVGGDNQLFVDGNQPLSHGETQYEQSIQRLDSSHDMDTELDDGWYPDRDVGHIYNDPNHQGDHDYIHSQDRILVSNELELDPPQPLSLVPGEDDNLGCDDISSIKPAEGHAYTGGHYEYSGYSDAAELIYDIPQRSLPSQPNYDDFDEQGKATVMEEFESSALPFDSSEALPLPASKLVSYDFKRDSPPVVEASDDGYTNMHAPRPQRTFPTAHLSSPILMHGEVSRARKSGINASNIYSEATDLSTEESGADERNFTKIPCRNSNDLHISSLEMASEDRLSMSDVLNCSMSPSNEPQDSVIRIQRQGSGTDYTSRSVVESQGSESAHGLLQDHVGNVFNYHNTMDSNSDEDGNQPTRHFTDTYAYLTQQPMTMGHVYNPFPTPLPSQHVPSPTNTPFHDGTSESYSLTQLQSAIHSWQPMEPMSSHGWVLDLAIARTKDMIEEAEIDELGGLVSTAAQAEDSERLYDPDIPCTAPGSVSGFSDNQSRCRQDVLEPSKSVATEEVKLDSVSEANGHPHLQRPSSVAQPLPYMLLQSQDNSTSSQHESCATSTHQWAELTCDYRQTSHSDEPTTMEQSNLLQSDNNEGIYLEAGGDNTCTETRSEPETVCQRCPTMKHDFQEQNVHCNASLSDTPCREPVLLHGLIEECVESGEIGDLMDVEADSAAVVVWEHENVIQATHSPELAMDNASNNVDDACVASVKSDDGISN